MLSLRQYRDSRTFFRFIPVAQLFLFLFAPAAVRAQQHEDFDEYKVRLEAYMFYSNPSGSIQGASDTVPVDLQKNLGFNSYATFTGKVDWKLSHKNHLYVWISPFYTSRQTTIATTFTFKGQVFDAGLVSNSYLHSFLVAPGYQYDIIRRKRGHLGIGVQVDIFNTNAKISATGTLNGQQTTVTASASLLAPIPVAGPQFRLYLTDSPRVFVEGGAYGMYLFGYGDFVSSAGSLGVTLNKHFSLTAGYQLGSRLIVNNSSSSNRIGLNLTQQGAIAGIQYAF